MRIKSIRIRNYKSYRDSGPISFGSKFNVIVGQNNAGKTALLETLDTLNLNSRPHRRLDNGRPATVVPNSSLDITISLSGGALKRIFLSAGTQFVVPVRTHQQASQEVGEFFERDEIDIELTFGPESTGWNYNGNLDGQMAASARVNPDKASWTIEGISQSAFSWGAVIPEFHRAVYFSRAERLALTTSAANNETVLLSRAENLPTAVLHLQTRSPARFARLNGLLHQVFPNIHGVTARFENNTAILSVWNIDPSMEYSELSVNLADCGTGVGQAIAILFVIVSADLPRIFVIDEPNSFLHPSAARSLIEILKGADHQYIVSTHNAEVISISEPSTLHLIRWKDGCSVVEALAADQITEVRRALNDVGVRLAEVFGADSILWVEGETERICFPLLMKRANVKWPPGLSLVSILNTGDFEQRGRKADLVWRIYERLSATNALLPPALAFSFDRDNRTEQQIVDLQRRSKSTAHFLPRRMYENYLIVPDALAAVIAESCGETIPKSAIVDWINTHGGDRAYEAAQEWNGDIGDAAWLRQVRGANLLVDLFSSLTDCQLDYDKVIHSVRLTEWLLENAPHHLSEVTEYVSGLIALQTS